MRRFSVVKKLLFCFCLLVAFSYWIGQGVSYPKVWDRVSTGLTVEEVEDLVGPGDQNLREWKGDYWSDDRVLTRHTLNVYFEAGTAIIVSIETRVSTEKYERVFSRRLDYIAPSPPNK